ncbi:hypothetical protein A9K55_001212 [Cordyceps militaris]|uniref:Uncharacterized protein n=1 Tax=Cordyceps militaris TaxID=73501 RepID=A0A2H4STD9_CORMI|nr:hypothetical protein A9K55_001212 [Cordyceps militaris]
MCSQQLPITARLWRKQVEDHGLEDDTLFTIAQLKSASKIELPQFLMLRVVYDEGGTLSDLEELFADGAVTAENWKAAKASLDSCREYQDYIKGIFAGKQILGSFGLARLYQMRSSELISESDSGRGVDSSKISVQKRITRSQTQAERGSPVSKSKEAIARELAKLAFHTPKQPSGGGSSSSSGETAPSYLFSPTSGTPIPPSVADKVYRFIEDEQIVNFSLLLLLDVLTLICPAVRGFWSPYRSPFLVRDAGVEIYEARVDGVFRPQRDRPGNIIVEVKPHSRAEQNDVDVSMQESAQMAAWIADYPDLDDQIRTKKEIAALKKRKEMAARLATPLEPGQDPTPVRKYRRALISQNRRDVFITIGSYNEGYIDYIRNVNQTDSFLVMNRYGPFTVTDASHMERLCHMMLALSLQGRILNE